MKRTLYTIAVLLSSMAAAQAQTPIKQTREKLADLHLVGEDLVVYAVKTEAGQFLYSEKVGDQTTYRKETALNAGAVNAVIGANAAGDELYVYQKTGRKDAKIATYRWNGADFQKTGEKPFPALKNHSYNLGAYLSPDQSTLVISADLRKTKGYEDLYLSKWENGKWSKPANLGAALNTRDAEFSPYLVNDSLYFSQKAGEQAFVTSVPFAKDANPTGQPAKVGTPVNQEQAFTAGYKRIGQKEMWISRTPDGLYTAYLTGYAPVQETPEPVPQPVAEAAPAPTELTLNYGFNEVFMTPAQAASFDAFLAQQADSASLWVKGYSDNVGPAKAKANVARLRAELLKKYIQRYHANRQFKVETASDVLGSEGPEFRKVEVHLHSQF
ncbi:hypothetical protein [Rufibacter psychrotolerans]|uniref:hypothetical protein n=1 Tax=Rufibacter psychrotolerans TaxID=2812556 RepID=UPI001967EE32|nr:hypothetical protein [Rufibacter sp. SYSU D00308]